MCRKRVQRATSVELGEQNDRLDNNRIISLTFIKTHTYRLSLIAKFLVLITRLTDYIDPSAGLECVSR